MRTGDAQAGDARNGDVNDGAPERSDPLLHGQRRARRPSGSSDRLRRSRDDRRIAGIAGGVARFVDADPRWVRILFVVTVPLSFGLTVLGYLVFWALLPSDPPPNR